MGGGGDWCVCQDFVQYPNILSQLSLPPPPPCVCLSVSVSFSLTHTHTHTFIHTQNIYEQIHKPDTVAVGRREGEEEGEGGILPFYGYLFKSLEL